MKIKKLHIKNFKSLVDLEIVEPNPFTVFVGANGVGKSNIFEALEFFLWSEELDRLRTFGSAENIQNKSIDDLYGKFIIQSDEFSLNTKVKYYYSDEFAEEGSLNSFDRKDIFRKISRSFSRYFVGKVDYQKINYSDSSKLNFACTNLEKVLKRLLQEENEELTEYLQLFVPEFEKVEIHSDNIGGTDTLLIYEKGSKKPFNKNLISDGTYNILCLLTAVYQSDEPQFLCIEEPENGLNPFVIKELVTLFRNACEEKGHYIWLNTHSQSLVEALTPDEIILVDKVNGETKIKQTKGMNLHGLPTDEAWLSGALGGGTPW
ncbi:AAA family ATPase [Dyadobacter sp. LHD-138]|uniref:AAA family ATPase n=1 Tax=Dyadobacter sp. LHD-138 TaxID=3071413 RepID=UPI0027E06E14|nr:AAA family ATPase [Dyadobacter sp. LHD-138]MDQ6479616.1 AAA family ATPase [Dyadobacter sp. LHD-138]